MTTMPRYNLVLAHLGVPLLSVLTACNLVGCGRVGDAATPNTQSRSGAETLTVTCTIGMIADTARHVAGEHATVTALMGPGVDPHLYKATHGDLEKLESADLILYNGLHLEGKMADVLETLGRTKKTVQVTETIPKELLRQPPEFEGQYDPHVWFDVSLWKHVTMRIRDALSEAAPMHRDVFSTNADVYLAKLDELDAYARERIATIPRDQRVLITAHDAFGYFGRAYDIDVMGLQGISTAAEYGAQDLTHLVDVIVERKIKAVFIESSISPKSIEALMRGVEGKGHSVALGGQLYSDAMGDAGTPEGEYIGMVRYNVDTIVNALM